jgi:hypothetical protein
MFDLLLSNFIVKKLSYLLLYFELDYLNVFYFVINRKVLLLLCYIALFSV